MSERPSGVRKSSSAERLPPTPFDSPEYIRGVATASGTLDVLLKTGWIRPRGRRKSLSAAVEELEREIPGEPSLEGAANVRVRGVHHDSRRIVAGDLFVHTLEILADGATGSEKSLSLYASDLNAVGARIMTLGGVVAPFAMGVVVRRVGEFVGRRREERRILQYLRDLDGAGVLLRGIGGVGKSSLSAEVLRSLYEDGWVVATVFGKRSPDEILDEVGPAGVQVRDVNAAQDTADEPLIAAFSVEAAAGYLDRRAHLSESNCYACHSTDPVKIDFENPETSISFPKIAPSRNTGK